MKTDSPLIVLLLWLIALALSSLILHSCNPCELKEEYTVSINDARAIDMHGSLWSGYTPTDVQNEVMSNLRTQLASTPHLNAVTGESDVRIYIDTIITDSYEWDESRTDPCYGDRSWLYEQLHPPEVYTYRLHRTNIIIVYSIVDSLHLQYGYGRAYGQSAEALQQPAGDSAHCYQYEVAGNYDHSYAMRKAAENAVQNFVCEIKKMMEP